MVDDAARNAYHDATAAEPPVTAEVQRSVEARVSLLDPFSALLTAYRPPPTWVLLVLAGLFVTLTLLLVAVRLNTRRASLRGSADELEDLTASALRGYALALVEVGRLADAGVSLQAHLVRVPTDAHIRAVLGASLEAQGYPEDAVGEYQRALQIVQHASADQARYASLFVAGLHRAAADALSALGHPEQADTHRRAALAVDPRIGQVPAGEHLRLLADFARVEELERRALDDLPAWEQGRAAAAPFGVEPGPEAVAFYRAAAKAAPTNARLHGYLAEALHAVGSHDAAEREFQEGLRLAPQDPWLRYSHGTFFWRRSNLANAERELVAAAQSAPHSAGIRGTLAAFYIALQRYAEAKSELVAALHVRPDIAALARLYGTAELRAGRPEEAVRAFQEADRLGAGDVSFRLAYGELLERIGNLDAAAEQYRGAVRRDPTSGVAHVRYGAFLQQQGRLAEAERVLDEATLLADAEEADQHLARLFLLERRLSRALTHIDAGLRVAPGDAGLKECQAEWLLLRGRAAAAEHTLAQLLNTSEPRASLQFLRGQALLAMDRQLEAQAALREALRLDPRFPDTLLFRARALVGNGFAPAALDALAAALLLRPDWPEALAEREQVMQAIGPGRRTSRGRSFDADRR